MKREPAKYLQVLNGSQVDRAWLGLGQNHPLTVALTIESAL